VTPSCRLERGSDCVEVVPPGGYIDVVVRASDLADTKIDGPTSEEPEVDSLLIEGAAEASYRPPAAPRSKGAGESSGIDEA